MNIYLTTQILKENDVFIAYAPELDISSCGRNPDEAAKNLREAVELFIETAMEQGTLQDILEECGFSETGSYWKGPEIISSERLQLSMPA